MKKICLVLYFARKYAIIIEKFKKFQSIGGKVVKMTKIAIIDSGISPYSSAMPTVENRFSIVQKGEVYEIEESEAEDNVGHGTAITDIIYQQNQAIQLSIFKITTEAEEIQCEHLCMVLEYILENLTVDLINISAGVTYIDYYERFASVCNALKQKGVYIVAAFDNDGAISYPAEFPTVLGVDLSEQPMKKMDVFEVKNSCVNFLLPSKFYRTVWNDGTRTVLKGTSFACAELTGRLSKHMYDDSGKRRAYEDIVKHIVTHTYTYNKTELMQGPKFQIKKAILFPINKEAHAILRFQELLPFELTAVYDERVSGHVGKEMFGRKIESYNQIDWEGDFDTIILSCITRLASLTKKDYVKEIVEQARANGKNIYTFEEIDSDYEKIFYPTIRKEFVPYGNHMKLRRISMPLVGVFGTSSSQGKYTLQLSLMKKLQEKGYDTGFLATEPSGYLFGADSVYHFGYEANFNLAQWESVLLLNELVWQMDKKGHDIGITGCQSATIHYDSCNLKYLSLEQQNFIFGTKPDFYVICVNPHDSLEYIKRTIQYLNSIDVGRVYALAVYPVKVIQSINGMQYKKEQMTQEEVLDFIDYLGEKCELPVFEIGNEESMEQLTRIVIQTFSGEV